MIEAFVSGFWQVLAWPVFGYLLIGIAIGFFVGLLPGLGGLATLALMLPFSYTIKQPVEAFCFLLGMLAVTGTTGDITSILFGIPWFLSSSPPRHPCLWHRREITPVKGGLFAIPKIVDLALRGTSNSEKPKEKLTGVM